jgi:hypothetical protein
MLLPLAVRLLVAASAAVVVIADGAISGVVTDAVTGRAVTAAVVSIAPKGVRTFDARRQFTDAKGRFVFTDLAPDAGYTISVSKAGCFDGAYGRLDPRTYYFTPIALTEGQWFVNADVKLWRYGAVSGMVTDERGDPVIGVFVRVLARGRVAGQSHLIAGPIAITDDRGMYRVTGLPSGTYVVMVPSAVSSVPGPSSKGSDPPGGERGQTPSGAALAGITSKIDGHYPIPPPPVGGRALTYPITFSGGATAVAQATDVELGPAAEQAGVNVQLNPVPSVRVSGLAQGSPDSIAKLVLRLLPAGLEDLGLGAEAASALVAADGSFVFLNVPAGDYTIDAPITINEFVMAGRPGDLFYGPSMPQPPGIGGLGTDGSLTAAPGTNFNRTSVGQRTQWARTPVVVGGRDEVNVTVTLNPAGAIRGRIAVDTDPSRPPPATAAGLLTLETATGSAWQGTMDSVSRRVLPPDEFAFDKVLPGQYLFRPSGNGWLLKSVIVNGRDYVDTPLDTPGNQAISGVVVTFTNAAAGLSGAVRRAGATEGAPAAVIVFPVEREQWTSYGLAPRRIKATRTTTTGAYQFAALPAGEYYLIAVESAHMDDWQMAGFFARAVPSATRVSVTWSESKTRDLIVSDVR